MRPLDLVGSFYESGAQPKWAAQRQLSGCVALSARDLFYLTGSGNNIAVFNPNTQAFGQPLQSSTINAGAVLEEEALTPDSSKLLVVDPAD
jgi:hypothetical protein